MFQTTMNVVMVAYYSSYGDIKRTHFHVLKSEQQILMDWVSFDIKLNWKNDLKIIEKSSRKNTENFGKIK